MTGEWRQRLKEKAAYLWQDKENLLFCLWIIWMAVYYGVRMFALTPWYDELYTYYYFISRGPVYAAIHWPLPNNHVGYSVLSAFLDWTQVPQIGLRGVAFLSSLGSLVLLYRICRRCFLKGFSFCCVLLYSCMNLVNQLAVQGRGYSLAAFCFLAALYFLQSICLWQPMPLKEVPSQPSALKEVASQPSALKEVASQPMPLKETGSGQKEGGAGNYIFFSASLILGLYTLPSSVYWVLPLCLTGGLFLLFAKKIRQLLRLIGAAFTAALGTLSLYLILWLSIGSNLLTKTEGGPFYGMEHVKIILSAPFAAAGEGILYMLATPYIQSVERTGFLSRFGRWLRTLLDSFYSGLWMVLAALILAGAVLCIFCLVRFFKNRGEPEAFKERTFFTALLIPVFLAGTPTMLAVQCALPYFRVFSYMGILIALCLCFLLQSVRSLWSAARGRSFSGLATVALMITAIVLLLSKSYNREYGTSEYYARDALSHAELSGTQALCVTDCYEQYLLKFYWGIECESRDLTQADYVLLHKDMEREEPEGFRWESYCSYADIPWDYMEESMTLVYGNEEYDLFKKKGAD